MTCCSYSAMAAPLFTKVTHDHSVQGESPALPDRVKASDRVDGTVEQLDGAFTVLSIELPK